MCGLTGAPATILDLEAESHTLLMKAGAKYKKTGSQKYQGAAIAATDCLPLGQREINIFLKLILIHTRVFNDLYFTLANAHWLSNVIQCSLC